MAELWEVPTGLKLAELQGHTGYIGSVAFSPDGEMLATRGFDGWIMIWNTSSFSRVKKLGGGDSSSLVFTGDGKGLVCGSKLWDLNSDERTMNFRSHAGASLLRSYLPPRRAFGYRQNKGQAT
jgi:WD40 repeat protein